MKTSIPFQTLRHQSRKIAMASVALLITAAPAMARPPSPPEVVDHIKHRVGSLFNRIGRAIERASDDDDDDRYHRPPPRDERYYYEPVPAPLPPRQVVPPPHEEYYYTERDRPRDSRSSRHYTPDYQPEREYVEPASPPVRRKSTSPLPDPPKEVESPVKPRESSPRDFKTTQEPDLSKSDTSASTNKVSPPPVKDEKTEYATPVPNKSGFVYPPGMKQEAANMLDVRDMRPGQKVRDPRTGKIFLVP